MYSLSIYRYEGETKSMAKALRSFLQCSDTEYSFDVNLQYCEKNPDDLKCKASAAKGKQQQMLLHYYNVLL